MPLSSSCVFINAHVTSALTATMRACLGKSMPMHFMYTSAVLQTCQGEWGQQQCLHGHIFVVKIKQPREGSSWCQGTEVGP